MRNKAVISVVDDDESIRMALESLLRSSGYQARTYCDALEFLNSTGPAETQCLISDIQMPGMCGITLRERLIAMGFNIPTIFITAFPGELPRAAPDTQGLIACLPKPFEAERLLSCVETALGQPL